MTKIYHVAPADHEGDLESLYKQFRDESYEIYAERWPEAGELGQYHVNYVHCYATIDEAREHTHDGKIYEIDADALAEDYIDIEIDNLEFEHPMVADCIPAEYLTVVA